MIPVPKWIFLHYCNLWDAYKDGIMTLNQISERLGENRITTSVIVRHLRNAGWLTSELDSEDNRKRLHRLVEPNEVVRKIIKKE